ncbi:hypothetical protein [Flavobacterium stagni]|uniref:Uncharacterized protein n=1 Tax=Flavobacterium stagni TaxID=2506421 RepID=A0A4V1N2P4_9FLAO|nr:hypothetical protein [Flavobacterium stagni]RXR22821.1 hypothetical protein EQG61_06200 [Flavobacterium stagni]
MNRITVQRIIHYNCLLLFLLFIDVILPSKEKPVAYLDSIYDFMAVTGGQKKAFDDKIIMEFTNGERYRIAKHPDQELPKNTPIRIKLNRISNSVSSLSYYQNGWKSCSVSLLLNPYIFMLLAWIICTTLLNHFFDIKSLKIMLVGAMMSLTFFNYVYFFFY